jgi:hypothetical protein
MLSAAAAASAAGSEPRMTSLGALASKEVSMSAVEAIQRLAYQQARLNDNRGYTLFHRKPPLPSHGQHTATLSLLNYHRISWLHEFMRFFKPGLADRKPPRRPVWRFRRGDVAQTAGCYARLRRPVRLIPFGWGNAPMITPPSRSWRGCAAGRRRCPWRRPCGRLAAAPARCRGLAPRSDRPGAG